MNFPVLHRLLAVLHEPILLLLVIVGDLQVPALGGIQRVYHLVWHSWDLNLLLVCRKLGVLLDDSIAATEASSELVVLRLIWWQLGRPDRGSLSMPHFCVYVSARLDALLLFLLVVLRLGWHHDSPSSSRPLEQVLLLKGVLLGAVIWELVRV